MITGIIVAILIFMIIIIIHELGHFLAARFFGVKVEEFGIGIPPKAKILGKDKKGTIYTLNWIPIGGFVRLKGEDTSPQPSPLKERELDKFSEKSYFAKSIILLAGVFMNFLLAGIIFSILFFVGVKPISINTQIETDLDLKIIPNLEQAINSGFIKIGEIKVQTVENSLAEKAGIKKDDTLIKVNGIKVNNPKKIVHLIKNTNGILELTFNNNKIVHLNKKENEPIGMYIQADSLEINNNFEYKYGILDSIKYGFLETYYQSVLTFKGIGILAKNIFSPEKPKDRSDAIENMKGPIGIVDLVSDIFKQGEIIVVIILGAIISINLGVFNLLPIPALDGGRFLLITINTFFKKIFGDKINTQNFENYMHLSFFIILIALSLIIGYNDIINIINK